MARRDRKQQPLHPFVAGFIEARKQPLDEFIADHPQLVTPVLKAMSVLSRALGGKISREEALLTAGSTAIRGEDPQLLILFLLLWCQVAYTARQFQLIPILVRRMKALLPEDSHEVLRLIVLEQESVVAALAGNLVERERFLRECLAVCPPGHRQYLHIRRNWVLYLAQCQRLSECSDEMEALERAGSGKWVVLARFLQDAGAGRYREALDVLPLVDRDPELVGGADFAFFRVFLQLMRDRWSRPVLKGPLPEGLPGWAVATDELLARRPERALAAVRPKPDETLEKFVIEAGFDSYSLIRAELACGHGEAARRLLEMRRARGNASHLDDFFLARVELLAGNFDAAVRHFAAVARACDRYDCRPALDFELRLACELAPGDLARLAHAAASAPEEAAPTRKPEPGQAPAAPQGLSRLVGRSPALENIRAKVRQLAPLDAPVLITGETGTGKELVARAMHEEGPRRGKPFVAVNCGAITETLLESELFGHERGAFTGATRRHAGMFEEAGKGIILLDEIGDVSPRLQIALLRVLETGEIRPVGASRSRNVSCRIVAATNADLDALADKGIFRKDLLFRLRRLELHIPPLRERAEDIVPLAEHFLCEGRRDGRQPAITERLRAVLLAYRWPGNVRELRNEIERFRLLNSDGLVCDVELLEPGRLGWTGAAGAANQETTAKDGPGAVPPAPETSRTSGGAARHEVAALLAGGRTPLRRLDRLRDIFREHGKLTRAEAARVLGISQATATRDLALLCREGFVERIMPNASPRTHYFRLRPPLP